MKPLTAREAQILRLLAEGFTDAQVAEQLGTSVYTVRTQHHTILGKLGAKNIAHAVTLGFLTGILTMVDG